MPCACCGEDPAGTDYRYDPLRWEIEPPVTEDEWKYLADMKGAPEHMTTAKFNYMNKICRGCYNARLEIMTRVRKSIREKGGMEQMNPTQRMKKDYERAHEGDIVANRPARIQGLQSAAAAALNGQVCKLLKKDEETERWTVELVTGEQKAIKEANLEVSKDIDLEWDMAQAKFFMTNPGAYQASKEVKEAERRPLGEQTKWKKVKGIHPGAVVRLCDLKSAPQLNGRKGRLVTFDDETGRWKVDLGDEYKSLKVDNLTPAPTEKPPTRGSADADKTAVSKDAERRAAMSAREKYAEEYGWDG